MVESLRKRLEAFETAMAVRRRFACVLSVALVAMLAACASGQNSQAYQDQLNGWIGADESALIDAWGPPHRSYQTKEIKYLTWERRSLDVQPRTYTGVMGSNRGVGLGTGWGWGPAHVTEWSCDTTFEVSHDGVIEGWQYEGNNCVAR